MDAHSQRVAVVLPDRAAYVPWPDRYKDLGALGMDCIVIY